jgi:glycosyltransferase involved in cell wall biosynthesis
MNSIRKLLIVARVDHYLHDGRFYAYTPYAREIDLWADLFPEVAIAGTLHEKLPPRDCSPFAKKNVRVLPVLQAGGNNFPAKLSQLLLLPKIIWQLAGYMRQSDAIHARCPCDLGLLGLIMGPMFTHHLIAKYAGQWRCCPNEPMAWRWQRALLCSSWWSGPVTVYSSSSNQPAKVIPFFTSVLSDENIARARIAANTRRDPNYFRVLFVGRLSAARNVDVLLRAVSKLKIPRRTIECVIVGEGPERAALQNLAAQLGIQNQTKFTGGLVFEKVLDCYEFADALVLAAESEGWGKAVTEAMAFGCVCIGSNRGMMPQILGENRGLLIPPRDVVALENALQQVADDPAESALMSKRAAEWAQKLSIDGMREALRKVMNESWTVPLEKKETLPPKAGAFIESEPEGFFK